MDMVHLVLVNMESFSLHRFRHSGQCLPAKPYQCLEPEQQLGDSGISAITNVMNFNLLLLLILMCGAVLIFRKLSAARRRRIVLAQRGRVSSWEDIQSRPDGFVKFVQTDFGYGREIWLLSTPADEIDLELRAFKHAILIAPRPKLSELRKFCKLHGLGLDFMMVK